MFRILAVLALLLPLVAGCGIWQANRASQAVDVDPLAFGTGGAVFTPANGPGYMNGEPQDMRRR
jgi:hypothetical protein